MLSYHVHYTPVGQRAVTATYTCNQALEPGQWIDVNGVYLIVDRVVRGKPGDPYAGTAFCKPIVGG